VRDIHVEVDKNCVDTIKPILYRIYGHESTGPFPNCVKMRLVPEITPLMGPSSKAKAEKLRNCQANFVKYSVKASTWELATLDYIDNTLGHSLCHMLMSIRVRNRPHIGLFHSGDPQWQGNGHVVTFIPDFEAEACTVLAGIIPFLRHTFPNHHDRIHALFTPSAVERSYDAHWDPDAYAVITAKDGILGELEEIDSELDLLPPAAFQVEGGPARSDQPSRPDPGNLQRHNLYGGETDSVSMIVTQGTRRS